MAVKMREDPFASKSLTVTVGPDNARFNIHHALLRERTCFFDIHPTENGSRLVKVKHATPEMDRPVKMEGSPATEPESSETISAETPSTADSAVVPITAEEVISADYHIDTRFVEAFAVFVHWLYNKTPTTPKHTKECRTLIQAYLLAQIYQAFELQDLLVSSIRAYHAEHTVDFDGLFVYLLNRAPGSIDCNLVKYFVDQIAYEIVDTGVEGYGNMNKGFNNFLSNRPNCQARVSLFYEVGRLAGEAKSGQTIKDPANMTASQCPYYTK